MRPPSHSLWLSHQTAPPHASFPPPSSVAVADWHRRGKTPVGGRWSVGAGPLSGATLCPELYLAVAGPLPAGWPQQLCLGDVAVMAAIVVAFSQIQRGWPGGWLAFHGAWHGWGCPRTLREAACRPFFGNQRSPRCRGYGLGSPDRSQQKNSCRVGSSTHILAGSSIHDRGCSKNG